jgi:hypothetical protein
VLGRRAPPPKKKQYIGCLLHISRALFCTSFGKRRSCTASVTWESFHNAEIARFSRSQQMKAAYMKKLRED